MLREIGGLEGEGRKVEEEVKTEISGVLRRWMDKGETEP